MELTWRRVCDPDFLGSDLFESGEGQSSVLRIGTSESPP